MLEKMSETDGVSIKLAKRKEIVMSRNVKGKSRRVLFGVSVGAMVLLISLILIVISKRNDAGTGAQEERVNLNQALEKRLDNTAYAQSASKSLNINADFAKKRSITLRSKFQIQKGNTLWEIAADRSVYGDPYLWKKLVMSNKDKVRQVLFDDETEKWFVFIDPDASLRIERSEVNESGVPKYSQTPTYILQLKTLGSSGLDKAKELVRYLIRGGYCAYIYQAPFKLNGPNIDQASQLYRVRVGFYAAAKHASSAGEEILPWYGDTLTSNFMVLPVPRKDRYGRGVLFGLQRNAPWVVEITRNRSLMKTMDHYRRAWALGEFTYIRKNLLPLGGFFYSVRLGFFPTKSAARRVLESIQSLSKIGYRRAKVIELFDPAELSPGQFRGDVS